MVEVKVGTVAGGAHRTQSTLCSSPEVDLQEAECRVGEVKYARESKNLQGEWFADVVPDLSQVPPMPSSCVQDLRGWLFDRNFENALESPAVC